MSTNVSSNNCGCSSNVVKQPDDLAVIPAGSVVVQTPCAENCTPQSSTPLTSAQGGGSTGTTSGACDRFSFAKTLSTFNVVAVGKTGQFNAQCASTWAKPGQRLWFSGLNAWLEVIGASGDVVSYRNLSMDAGTQILEGTEFMIEAPAQAFASDDDGNDFSNGSSTLDAIYGEDSNSYRQIVPVDGHMLYACGGKWQRRRAGLMSYPITQTKIVDRTGQTFVNGEVITVSLPSLPSASLLNCSLGLRVELMARLGVWTPGSGTSSIDVKFGDQHVVGGTTDNGDDVDSSYAVLDLDKTATNIAFTTTRRNGSGAVTYNFEVWVKGYQY